MLPSLDLSSLATLVSECEAGVAVVIRCELEKHRALGGRIFNRYFWKAGQSGAWRELSLALDLRSLWHRMVLAWPPEHVLELSCDPEGITCIFQDDPDFPDSDFWIREARFNFRNSKWSLHRIRKWDYDKDGDLPIPSRYLSEEEQAALDRQFGKGLPRFPAFFF